MHLPQVAVDLQKPVIPIRGKANGLVGTNQAAKPLDVRRGGWHALCFIDDHPGQQSPALVQGAQLLDQFFIRVPVGAGTDHPLDGVERFGWDDRLEGRLFFDPHLRDVHHSVLLELERNAVVNVVADVLFVGEDLVNRGTGPGAVEVGCEPQAIKTLGNLRFDHPLIDEPLVDLVDRLNLGVWAGHQDHTIGLQALVLAPGEFTLHGACLVDQYASQAIPCGAPLAVAKLDQAALTGKHLGGQLPAVFARHSPFDALDDGGYRGTVVLELLGAVGDLNPSPSADVLVVGAFVGVLEPPPAADVIDQNDLEVGLARFDEPDQFLQP